MDSTTIIWTLIATVTSGLHLFTNKMVAQKGLNASLNGVLVYGATCIFFALCFFFTQQEVPFEWFTVIVLALCAGVAHGIGSYARIESLKNIDSVLFFPINKVLGPIIAVFGGILIFSEVLSFGNALGVIAGIGVPLLLIQKTEHLRQNNLWWGSVLLVVATFFGTISHFFAKGATAYDSGLFFYMTFAQIFAIITSLIFLYSDVKKKGARWTPHAVDIKYAAITCGIGIVAYYSFLKALATGPISLVYAIHAHYIVITILLSVWLYKEHMDFRKFAAVVLSLVAIGLLV